MPCTLPFEVATDCETVAEPNSNQYVEPSGAVMSKTHTTFHRTLSNVILSSIIVFPIAAADTVSTSEFCINMNVLTLQAGSNFFRNAPETTALVTPRPLPDAEKCMMAQSLSGGNAYHCSWKFPYRDVAANVTFNTFNQMMRDCFSDGVEAIEDLGVNHPDSYHQRQFFVDQAVVRVSIKDKGTLQETYVFISVQGAIID